MSLIRVVLSAGGLCSRGAVVLGGVDGIAGTRCFGRAGDSIPKFHALLVRWILVMKTLIEYISAPTNFCARIICTSNIYMFRA